MGKGGDEGGYPSSKGLGLLRNVQTLIYCYPSPRGISIHHPPKKEEEKKLLQIYFCSFYFVILSFVSGLYL